MNEHTIRRHRRAVVALALFSMDAIGFAFRHAEAEANAAYQAGEANGFIRGSCYTAGELDARVAAEVADECEEAEQRHAKRLGRVL